MSVLHLYALPKDVLRAHSTPLVLHHASALGDWIREVERKEEIEDKGYGSTIGWYCLDGKRGLTTQVRFVQVSWSEIDICFALTPNQRTPTDTACKEHLPAYQGF